MVPKLSWNLFFCRRKSPLDLNGIIVHNYDMVRKISWNFFFADGNSKGSLQNFDNDYCMADVLFYITSGLEQEVPELVERTHELTIECKRLLPHGLA